MASPSRREQQQQQQQQRQRALPSLIDFGDDNDPATSSSMSDPFGWAGGGAAASNGGTDFRSSDSFSTPYKPSQQHRKFTQQQQTPSPQPDLLTGDFPVTPPTTIPGVPPLFPASSNSSNSSNPFDSPSDGPFVARNTNDRYSPPSVSSSPANKTVANSSSSKAPSTKNVRHSQSTPELKPAVPSSSPPKAHAGALHGPSASEGVIPLRGSLNKLSPQASPPATVVKRSSEFIAGGGKGVYKPPLRGPVDPDRPVPFDLRPSPMRTNQPARALTCTGSSVWLACDGALKVWDVANAMSHGSGGDGNPPDDIDAAAFTYMGVEGMTLCLVADAANKLVWSGHRDGKVRAWSTEELVRSKRRTEPSLCWIAHRSPVLSMVITTYGELWTGSDGGAIRAWPWETTSHALCRAEEETMSAASLMARSYVDLRARGTAAGATSLANTDVYFLLSEHANGRVWSGGPLALAIWDARTRDVLKVFGPSVQSEFSSPDISPVRDSMWDDDVRSSMSKASKKEKAGTLSFFQRVIGAADAVRRAASGGQGGDDSKKVDALVAAVDGTVWGGYPSGMIIQWDGLGNRLQATIFIPVPVRSLCAVGTRIWVGYADGRIQVLADTGKVLGVWIAHSAAIVHMEKCGSFVFTMALHGGIRGWNIGSPCPIDGILQIEMQSKAETYTQERTFKILAGTWNVAEEKASLKSMQMWLASATHAGVVFVGLQETEMSAGAIAMAAAKETVGLQEKSSANGQWWLDNLGAALGENQDFVRVGSRQLAGILIGVWVRNELIPFVGEIDAAAVPCGFGRALGNKGGVGVKILLYRRTFCFLSSHLAAHMDAVGRRNADFEHIYHQMKFGRSSGGSAFRGATVRKTASPDGQEVGKEVVESETVIEAVMPDLADADMIVWVGDFNYRIDDLAYEDAIDLISSRQWEVLLPKDQLRIEMTGGRVFQGMREGPLRFQPTYKFDKGYSNPLGYDSSEKKRIPAWCDRVIFRDSYDGTEAKKKFNLSHPVSASVISYDSCMDALDSDHKPVRCLLNVDIAVINEAARRRAFCELMLNNPHVQKWMDQLNSVPETVVSTNKIILEDGVPSILKAINESSRQCVVFELRCEGDPAEATVSAAARVTVRAGFGLPPWLQVTPASGMIPPKGSMEINLKFMNVLPDDFMEGGGPAVGLDNRGKAVNLAFSYKGSLSSSCKRYQVAVSSPSVGQGSQDREPKFRLQRSNVLASRLNSEDTKDLLLL
ncbi:type II inositol polyphosphate 5-phosphatase 15 [Selaginella moellendorffii]|uniref:type II inositol polyphosphate 5-phosphatase 15 n=1 Tax=Selaginella moellendorffii TaxID=88036 RepID=UPI000D1C7AD2|nr:type II inositol polyphosphate 5-phosphatase 15 [Selaginella moellendorffii]|eukprot:XP_024524008.1 type II inositol polyphosphate 5-phosphatase 15 [Selaginella moellendorffii]